MEAEHRQRIYGPSLSRRTASSRRVFGSSISRLQLALGASNMGRDSLRCGEKAAGARKMTFLIV
jgi:hypothetical protein